MLLGAGGYSYVFLGAGSSKLLRARSYKLFMPDSCNLKPWIFKLANRKVKQ